MKYAIFKIIFFTQIVFGVYAEPLQEKIVATNKLATDISGLIAKVGTQLSELKIKLSLQSKTLPESQLKAQAELEQKTQEQAKVENENKATQEFWKIIEMTSTQKQDLPKELKAALDNPDVDVNSYNSEGDTPLIFALRNFLPLADLLMTNKRVDVNKKTRIGMYSPVSMIFATFDTSYSTFDRYIQRFLDNERVDWNDAYLDYGMTPLSSAIRDKDVKEDLLKKILEKMTNVNTIKSCVIRAIQKRIENHERIWLAYQRVVKLHDPQAEMFKTEMLSWAALFGNIEFIAFLHEKFGEADFKEAVNRSCQVDGLKLLHALDGLYLDSTHPQTIDKKTLATGLLWLVISALISDEGKKQIKEAAMHESKVFYTEKDFYYSDQKFYEYIKEHSNFVRHYENNTPLIFASFVNENTEVVKKLIEFGANVNAMKSENIKTLNFIMYILKNETIARLLKEQYNAAGNINLPTPIK